MKKVCIVQLTRIGDILQTYQAARQFKLENPNLSLSLVSRRSMAKDLIFILKDVFDDIFLFETSDFFPVGTKNFSSAKENLKVFISELNSEKFDLLVNFSFTKSSSYLMSLIDSKLKMGPIRTFKNELSIPDKWSQYVYSNILDSNYGAYNLVDIYKNILGAKDNHSFARKTVQENTIVIHPFASHNRKMWNQERWAGMVLDILNAHPSFSIHLLGAKSEQEQALSILNCQELKNYKHRIINSVGKLTIQESFDVVNSSKLFIGHDSMVSHLASIAEKESLVISLGQVKPYQTAPYNDKAITLVSNRECSPCSLTKACNTFNCHGDISNNVVITFVNIFLKNEKLSSENVKKSLNTFITRDIFVLKGVFRNEGMRLNNLLNSPQSAVDTLRDFYRVSFSFYLKDQHVNMQIPNLSNEAIHLLKELSKGIDFMYELYQHAMISCKRILELSNANTSEFKKVKEEIKKISEIDQLLKTTIEQYTLLKPMEEFFYVNRLNSTGKDLVEITQSNLISYYEAQNFLTFVEDLTNTTLGPKIVSRNLDL